MALTILSAKVELTFSVNISVYSLIISLLTQRKNVFAIEKGFPCGAVLAVESSAGGNWCRELCASCSVGVVRGAHVFVAPLLENGVVYFSLVPKAVHFPVGSVGKEFGESEFQLL